MTKGKFFLGFLWALPVTLVTFLFAVLPFWIMGWYRYVGWRELAWVWTVHENVPKWLENRWKRWAGLCLGNLIVLKYSPEGSDRGKMVLTHELEHTKQVMRLGVFHPIIYFLIVLAGKTMNNADGYYDNIFEIDARRKAGQIVDIIGLTKKLQEGAKAKR